MAEDKFITVTAPEGVTSPIHPNDGSDPNKPAGLQVTSGMVARVRYSQDIRRSIARGDLIPCTIDGKIEKAGRAITLDEADSPKGLHTGSVVSDEDLFEAKIKTRPVLPSLPKQVTANTDASNAPTVDMTTEGKR